MGNSLIIPMSGDVPSCNNYSGQQTVVTMDVHHQKSPDAAADAKAEAEAEADTVIELGVICDEGTEEEVVELLSGPSAKLSFKRKVEGYIIIANASGEGDGGNGSGVNVLFANFDDNWYKTEKIPEDSEIISKLHDAKFAYHEPQPNDGLKTITEYCAKINLGGTFVQHMARGLVEHNVKEFPAMIIIAEILAMVGLITCASSIILWKKHKKASEILAKFGCSATVAAAMSMMASMFFPTNLIWIPILGITAAIPCILFA